MGTATQSLRTRTFTLLQPEHDVRTIGWYVNWGIILLIALNVLAVILSTVDALYAAYTPYFTVIEWISVAIFTVEYLARVWSGIERPDITADKPLRARVRVAVQPMLLVDLLAIAPFYLARFGVGVDLRFLRALRLFRMLRMLKLVRYSDSMQSFGAAFRRKRDELLVALTANLILLLLASSLVYFAESPSQPDVFGSIPEAMWWGIATLTTVGYGDVTPITPTGRLLGGTVAVLGIGMFALPASILASGFMEEAANETTTCPACGYAFNTGEEINHIHYECGERVLVNLRAEFAQANPELRDYHGLVAEITETDTGEPGKYTVDVLAGQDPEFGKKQLTAPVGQIELDWRDLQQL